MRFGHDSRGAAEMLAVLDHLRIVETVEAEDVLMSDILAAVQTAIVSFINQHGFNLAAREAAMRDTLARSDFLLRDGVGIEVCLKLLGRAPGRNLSGTDLIPRLLARTKGHRIALFGTQEPWLGLAAKMLRSDGHIIVCLADGFQPLETYVELAQVHKPRVIVLAMGMPKQEVLSLRLRDALAGPCVVINGGAIADFLAGRQPRAPKMVRALRMEWLFRLAHEPGRLASRYIGGGFVFLYQILRLRAAERRLGVRAFEQ